MGIIIVNEIELEKYEKRLVEINSKYDVIDVEPDLVHGVFLARVTIKN